jgi:hypothetical protein
MHTIYHLISINDILRSIIILLTFILATNVIISFFIEIYLLGSRRERVMTKPVSRLKFENWN